ncbi:MAG: PfkB family carbohydrate kinase [Candidatus Micrarchaeota archaeon]
MEALFSAICGRIALERGRMFAFHNAVIDDVYRVPLSKEQHIARLARNEQRFNGRACVRLGGGGINFALCAASLGFRGASFVGFMDAEAFALAEKVKRENGLHLPLFRTETGPRRNAIIELDDANLLYHQPDEADPALLRAKLAMLAPKPGDWLASCSFYENMTFPLLEAGGKLFIDSGYGYPRRERNMLGSLCARLGAQPLPELIIAANETELDNIADEFGASGPGPVQKAHAACRIMSGRSGMRIRLLLHTESYSTLADPGSDDLWAVPAFDAEVQRRTNAGDTFAGAFMAAFAATGDAVQSCFFANAAAGKRISSDELPTPENTTEFLKKAKLREPKADVPVLKPGERFIPQASSALRKASRAAAAPAPGTAR